MHFFTVTLGALLLLQGLMVPNSALAQSDDSQCTQLAAYLRSIDEQIMKLRFRQMSDESDIRSGQEYSHISPGSRQKIIDTNRIEVHEMVNTLKELRRSNENIYLRNCTSNPTPKQEVQSSCPTHSRLSSDGETCECESGYVPNQQQNGCMKAIINKPTVIEKPTPVVRDPIPPKVSDCKDGYALSLNKTYCVKIPKNAHAVNSSSDVWLCNDGFVELGNTCVPADPPKKEPVIEEAKTPEIEKAPKSRGVWGWLKSLFKK